MCLFFSFVYHENIGEVFTLFQRGDMMKQGSFRIQLVKESTGNARVIIFDVNFTDSKTKQVRRI